MWQVNFAPEKTQAMIISLSPRRCLKRSVRPAAFWRQEPTTPGVHQCSGCVCGPQPALRPPHNCCRSPNFSPSLCAAQDGGHPRQTERPHTVQGADTLMYGVQCPVLDVECHHPHAETRCCAAASSATGGHRGGPAAASTSDVTGAPPGRVGTSGVPQDSGAGSLPPSLPEAAATHSAEMHQRCR